MLVSKTPMCQFCSLLLFWLFACLVIYFLYVPNITFTTLLVEIIASSKEASTRPKALGIQDPLNLISETKMI